MRALLLREFKGPDGLAVEDVEAPAPDERRPALIEVHAAGVSFADMLITRGEYQVRPPLPFVPGLEVAGTVEEVGTDVRTFQPGDPVCALVGGGGYAEYCAAPAPQWRPVTSAGEQYCVWDEFQAEPPMPLKNACW